MASNANAPRCQGFCDGQRRSSQHAASVKGKGHAVATLPATLKSRLLNSSAGAWNSWMNVVMPSARISNADALIDTSRTVRDSSMRLVASAACPPVQASKGSSAGMCSPAAVAAAANAQVANRPFGERRHSAIKTAGSTISASRCAIQSPRQSCNWVSRTSCSRSAPMPASSSSAPAAAAVQAASRPSEPPSSRHATTSTLKSNSAACQSASLQLPSTTMALT
mmetsp:Transcript_37509/g.87333  ORF Transcript_37509/g.87333 Transcript_37509/m.87333 type:complete len:223 (+) Transcript_37509:3369-4037(+)